MRFLRARPPSNDERVDSAVNDTNIINYLGKQPGPLNYRQVLSLRDGDRGQLIWNVSVPNSYFYVNYPATTNVRPRDNLHLTEQDNIIVGRLPSSNQPVWTFNSSVVQGRVTRLGVTDDSLFVVVLFFTHQELWKISLPQSFVEHQQETYLHSHPVIHNAVLSCHNYTDCLSYSCGKCVNNQCVMVNTTSDPCKDEEDCNQMITTCLSRCCQTMWPDCFGQHVIHTIVNDVLESLVNPNALSFNEIHEN